MRLLIVIICILLTGCGSSQIYVYVESTKETNGGRPFYMVVKAVEEKAYTVENYHDVADVVYDKEDKKLLIKEVIYPGKEKEAYINMPEDLSVGIYFLFTDPGEKWKTLLKHPLPSDVEFKLTKNEIETQE